MKASRLEIYLQQLIDTVVMEMPEPDEVGLGFDAMLSHDVVKFLMTDHSLSTPLIRSVITHPKNILALDEHELAML